MDNYNYLLKSHHRRVAVIAYAIGQQMKLSNEQLNDLVIAAAIHDIGALNIQDRDHILEVDISDPKPHSEMGYEILRGFDLFNNIATILRHHHIFYYDQYLYNDEVPIQSYIIHVADRIEVYISRDEPILDQKEYIRSEVKDRSGDLFHPEVCGAFELISRFSEFWLSINNMSLDQLFLNLDYGTNKLITTTLITDFSKVLARIVDFRSRCTAAHSLTVGNLAQHIGELMNKDDDFNTKLLVAGLLHDIGKLNINPAIITKESALHKEEYDELRKVPMYNQKILGDLSISPWFETVLNWISSQEEIDEPNASIVNLEESLGASIIHLSHIVTAMMEKRPYRKAYDIDAAIALMHQEFYSTSDKDLIAFIELHKTEINEIITTYETDGLAFYNRIETEFEY